MVNRLPRYATRNHREPLFKSALSLGSDLLRVQNLMGMVSFLSSTFVEVLRRCQDGCLFYYIGVPKPELQVKWCALARRWHTMVTKLLEGSSPVEAIKSVSTEECLSVWGSWYCYFYTLTSTSIDAITSSILVLNPISHGGGGYYDHGICLPHIMQF